MGKGKDQRNEEKIGERKRRRNGKEGSPPPLLLGCLTRFYVGRLHYCIY